MISSHTSTQFNLKKKSDAIVKIISNNVEIDIFSPYKIKSDNEGIGTGFFINSDGYILTCAHVVSGSIQLHINTPLEGKKKIPVTLHSICYDKDIAILKTIDYVNQDFCKLANSDKINSGENVTAVGYPLGQERLKKTKGIISGIQDRYIQIDAPINPGNSGGPLFNSNMEVIGINTAKISSFFAENIGYSTPINDYTIISKQMLHNQSTTQIINEPIFYCELQNTSEYHYKFFKYPEKYGCIVKNLVENTPLYNAGLRESDILMEFDKYKIDGNGDIDAEWSNDKVSFCDINAKCQNDINYNLVFWSLKKQTVIKTNVILNDDDSYKIKYVRTPFENLQYEIFAGMIVSELTMNHIENINVTHFSKNSKRDIAVYKKIKNRNQGVVFISSILQGSYASGIEDLSSGSIISNVNGKKIENINDFRSAVKNNYLTIDGHNILYMKLLNKTQILINIDNAYKFEPTLSERYKYKISKLYPNVIE